jgi:putative cell wall-binding protein
MKRLLPVILGLSLALGTVSVSFAQDQGTQTEKKKSSDKKKSEKKKKETTTTTKPPAS